MRPYAIGLALGIPLGAAGVYAALVWLMSAGQEELTPATQRVVRSANASRRLDRSLPSQMSDYLWSVLAG